MNESKEEFLKFWMGISIWGLSVISAISLMKSSQGLTIYGLPFFISSMSLYLIISYLVDGCS